MLTEYKVNGVEFKAQEGVYIPFEVNEEALIVEVDTSDLFDPEDPVLNKENIRTSLGGYAFFDESKKWFVFDSGVFWITFVFFFTPVTKEEIAQLIGDKDAFLNDDLIDPREEVLHAVRSAYKDEMLPEYFKEYYLPKMIFSNETDT